MTLRTLVPSRPTALCQPISPLRLGPIVMLNHSRKEKDRVKDETLPPPKAPGPFAATPCVNE